MQAITVDAPAPWLLLLDESLAGAVATAAASPVLLGLPGRIRGTAGFLYPAGTQVHNGTGGVNGTAGGTLH